MCCTQKIFFILCTITFIEAVNIKIDGLIDLGPNWSYEYKILSPGAASRLGDAKTNDDSSEEQDEKPHKRGAHTDHVKLHQDEERLTQKEAKLRKQAAELRKTVHHEKHKTPKESDKRKKTKHAKSNEKVKRKTDKGERKPRKHERKSDKHSNKKSEKHKKKDDHHDNKKKHEVKRKEKHHEFEKMQESLENDDDKKTAKHVTFSSKSEESSSLIDSDEATTPKEATRFDMYDFTTPKKVRKPIDPYEPTPEKVEKFKANSFEKHGKVNEDAASFIDKTNAAFNEKEKLAKDHHLNKTNENTGKVVRANGTVVTNATKPTTTVVTTMRTGDIYDNKTHKIKDDAKVNDFTNHLYKQTLKVFDVVKGKTSQYHVKKQIEAISKSYEDKFKEFLADTKTQKIKTRLGTQKVVLNTIDMSNRILNRLVNFMIGDMDKKGVLRHNVGTANIFQKEIQKEQKLELGHACKKFGICRSGKGFPEFLTDVLTILLQCDDKKFKQSIDALTEVAKNTNYHNALESHTEQKLKEAVDKMERLPVRLLRPIFMILKNVITHKNQPLIVETLSASHRVNSTLAFLEIIDLLDQKMPRNESNTLEWIDIETSLRDFADNKRYDVQEIMETIIKTLKKTLRALDKDSQRIISKNLNIIFG
ncbi:hypothetical protein B5X24_HaOG214128 [Helicoverpa armigera]|uniref:Uncharacterized protein n=1 Tax=Helicoverpa armigera TaxID=29058 RepID=A0A2W1BB48_HELAM|nr:hypothetical protein B5X24_HaOG214128 [Helicoverpa armigera]